MKNFSQFVSKLGEIKIFLGKISNVFRKRPVTLEHKAPKREAGTLPKVSMVYPGRPWY